MCSSVYFEIFFKFYYFDFMFRFSLHLNTQNPCLFCVTRLYQISYSLSFDPLGYVYSPHFHSSVQFSCSVVSNSLRPQGLQHARPPCPSPTPRVLLKLMSIESEMPSNHLILCRPLRLPPSIFPSVTVFSNESALCIRWPKDWSFSFNISPSSEHSGLISFRMEDLGIS